MAQNPFEIPEQLRDLTQRNIEQATAAYTQFMGTITQAMEMWSKPGASNAMTSGFKAVQDQAIKFMQHNTEAGLALAKDLANAKDIQEVLALQNKYVESQMQAYAQQSQELGQLMASAAQSAQPHS